MNVHISAASWYDYGAPEVKAFQQKFYDASGTIPDEDGFTGYDVTLFTGRMLKQHGLSFPDFLPRESFKTLQGNFQIQKHSSNPTPDSGPRQYDYLENRAVHILKFDKNGFMPVGN
jgi:hypothetical protein